VPAARFDLVPRNCHMPEVDGFACTRRLRAPAAEPGLSRTPIVALTASSEAEKVVACREAGRDDLLPKPVAFDALHAARAGCRASEPGPHLAMGGIPVLARNLLRFAPYSGCCSGAEPWQALFE
jgi:CheY-like chemotaxis protein